MTRYFQAPLQQHENVFCCQHCFDLIGYTNEDVMKKLKESTLSFDFVVECPSCGKSNRVKTTAELY